MMNTLRTASLCERKGMHATRGTNWACLFALIVGVGNFAEAQTTNNPAATNHSVATNAPASNAPAAVSAHPSEASHSTESISGEGAFHIVSERNIFNANRSGGKVQLSSSRRTTKVDSFTLVGTMAYSKGAFAFFDGSSSEYSKVIKANNVIGGHKLVDILTDSVKLEADGKQIELPIGSQMRREDGGAWKVAQASASSSSSSGSSYSSRSSGDSRRSDRDRSSRSESRSSGSSSNSGSSSKPSTNPTPATSAADDSDTLKRLLERREKD